MSFYEIAYLSCESLGEDTMAFRFEKPAGFTFRPGQFVDLALVDPPETDDSGDSRTFSLACAPHETELVIATRMRDTAFKRCLRQLTPGTRVEMTGPMGDLVLPETADRPLVFLAGGIGITPFISMLRHAAAEQLPHRMHLIYSNRRPELAAYLAELQSLAQRHERFRLTLTMTEMATSAQPWNGYTGFVDQDMIAGVTRDLPQPVYYVVGPPPMVVAMWEILNRMGVDRKDLHIEEFGGY